MPGVRFTSPAAGKVAAVNRGEKRVFQSVVVELSRTEIEGTTGSRGRSLLHRLHRQAPVGLTEQDVRDLLVESGLWTALRARPISRVANPADKPHSIFVTAADSNPLAPSVAKVMEGKESLFQKGLSVLAN